MTSITQVRQDMLDRMNQIRELSEGAAIKPAALQGDTGPAGPAAAFDSVLRAVDAQQHQASAAMAAVDSGKSEDLVGAMIDSQKASVSFSALLQVRNKLTNAFDEIMRMPL
ncbi:flagellar hook-basal body protein FliE [Pseudomonas sp. PIC25]|uniref:flagellar hook-basal body complex protein FliE n=1 Tax=Pseudomonas sp. PIC25 TaxID=1958773 RepID=UPI000BAB3439|nr:flagellar hook-basal body complex protein FliE [Pseudomonas sp. PIC25]PAU58368.1 flagellar hook-basal body protein FliE [Pseudomonas sp. PIC25]